jgi:uncharacterized protein YbcC (UPF0753/DUF2309 family)
MRTVSNEEFHRKFMVSNTVAPQLEAYWDEHLPSIPRPNRNQFEMWLHIHKYNVEPLRFAIRSAARRLTRTPFNDPQHNLQYISAVALSYLREQE